MQMVVRLHDAEEAKEFCRICDSRDFDVDVRSGRHMADGKSPLGVLSLNLSQPLVVSVHGGSGAAYADFLMELKRKDLINHE